MKSSLTEPQAIDAVNAAIGAIGKNTPEELARTFTEDASFFMTRNPYRIDDLETFRRANDSFFQAGGRITNFDIRQPRVSLCSDKAAAVSFHYSERLEIGGLSVGSNGRGTAIVIASDDSYRISHLHLSENGTGNLSPATSASTTDVLSAVDRMSFSARSALGTMAWGCE